MRFIRRSNPVFKSTADRIKKKNQLGFTPRRIIVRIPEPFDTRN